MPVRSKEEVEESLRIIRKYGRGPDTLGTYPVGPYDHDGQPRIDPDPDEEQDEAVE